MLAAFGGEKRAFEAVLSAYAFILAQPEPFDWLAAAIRDYEDGDRLLGGVVVDILRALTGGNNWIAYGTVFTIEAILLVIVLALAGELHIERATASTEAPAQPRAATDEVAAARL